MAEWQDAETLKRLYWEEGLSLEGVAERLGCGSTTVRRWMDRHDIPRRRERGAGYPFAPFRTNPRGYEEWRSNDPDGTERKMYVHRLLAVAEYGVEAVEGALVHHENELKWDNRPDNIVLMDADTHVRLHKPRLGTSGRDPGEEELRRLYWDEGLTQSEIAEEVGASGSGTVSEWMSKHGIETRERGPR